MVRWGDYKARNAKAGEPPPHVWQRTQREEVVGVALPERTEQPQEQLVAKSGGLFVAVSVRPVTMAPGENSLPAGTRSVSVFLVNRRAPKSDELRDEAFAWVRQLGARGADVGHLVHGDLPHDFCLYAPSLRSARHGVEAFARSITGALRTPADASGTTHGRTT